MDRKPRKKLVHALAYCIEALASQSLMESSGAIRSAIEVDDRIWDHLDDRTIKILGEGLGIISPRL
jgi:hypothetical protein